VVDTLGLLLTITVTAASVQDRDGAADVVAQACHKAPILERLYTDGAYGGQCAKAIEQTHDIRVEVVRRLGNRLTGTLQRCAAAAAAASTRGCPRPRRPAQALGRRARPWQELDRHRLGPACRGACPAHQARAHPLMSSRPSCLTAV